MQQRPRSRVAWLLGLLLLAGVAVSGWIMSGPPTSSDIDADLIGLSGAVRAEGFARVYQPREFHFPADHGPHPRYQTEWWYYTGNVETDTGRPFGYQLTFFRRALTPDGPERTSAWATNQIYMAHFAITDVAGGRFQAFERFSRSAVGLAGARAAPYRVWLEDWSAEETEPGVVRLRASTNDITLDLTLRSSKAPVLHGNAGLSQKSAKPGNASYYYSLTRIETAGTLVINGQKHDVEGLTWMDHEFGTSYLADNQVGWDWFSLQLDGGRELMYFEIRRADGSVEPLSGGTLVQPDGTTQHLERSAIVIDVETYWTSPRTGARYPAAWHIAVPSAGVHLDVRPYVADQELDVSYAYWEGAVEIKGRAQDEPVSGVGYVELTGYAGSMAGEF